MEAIVLVTLSIGSLGVAFAAAHGLLGLILRIMLARQASPPTSLKSI